MRDEKPICDRELTCSHCGGLHFGSPNDRCVYLCQKCGKDIRPDVEDRCQCAPQQLPVEVYEVWNAGFNFLHDPTDESPCVPTGPGFRCENIDHLRPVSKRTTTQEIKQKEIQMNNSSKLLVLGATGQVGKLVAENLKQRKANFSVGSRRKANLKELAHQFGASRFIDLDDPRTFDEALKNVTGIFLINGYTVDMLVQSKSLIDAAKRNGVDHIVHLGAFTTDHDSYATVFAWHQMIEAYLRNSGVAWTNLHPNMFMQNLLTYTSIKGAQYRPYTSKALGFTALEDLAESAAVILMDGPKKHGGRDYFFSADAVTPQQVAENLTVATGRTFTVAVRDANTFLKDATQPGSMFEPAYAKGGLEFFSYVEDGRMAYIGTVRDDTKNILGREPLLLKEWATLHANELLEILSS